MSHSEPAPHANFLICKMKIKIAAALGGLSIGWGSAGEGASRPALWGTGWVNKAHVYISQGQYYFLTSTERMLSCQPCLLRPAQDQIRMWTRKSLVSKGLHMLRGRGTTAFCMPVWAGWKWAEKIRVGDASCVAKVQVHPWITQLDVFKACEPVRSTKSCWCQSG